jgi:hypothetical protein
MISQHDEAEANPHDIHRKRLFSTKPWLRHWRWFLDLTPARGLGCDSREVDRLAKLEERFFGQVAVSLAGMKLDFANDIAKAILPKYEHIFATPPRGKRFDVYTPRAPCGVSRVPLSERR